jgi:TPR repeat protein
MAQRLAVLLDQPAASPEGVTAVSIKGGARYARGWAAETGKGAKQNVSEAAYWYALAGADGDGKALANLGTLLVRGQGVAASDPLGAALLWRAAAARGDAVAMYNLGVLHERGIGVNPDVERAKAWYQRAAARNHGDARAALKRLGT